VSEQGDRYGVRRLCRLLNISPSGYYAWRDRPASRRARQDAVLSAQIRAVFAASRQTYGYRRVHAQLVTTQPCGRDRVARLMRASGLQPQHKRRFKGTTQPQPQRPIAPNRLAQDFIATEVNQKWLADITFIPTDEGWLYLAAIEDLFSRFIAGWAMEDTLTDQLTRYSLQMALGRRRPSEGLIHHSDQGGQYASDAYLALLAEARIVQSMSDVGNAYDNAPMESFFSRLKNELTHHRHYHTRQEARLDIFEYIEVFYNRQRLHSALGYRSPLEFETLHATP
jgi:transposase InsO family protein